MRTCTIDDCDKPHCARGLCKTHYNQTLPARHAPKTAACVVCGKTITRSTGGGGRKYGATCSLDCRYALTHGARTELPEDHWARWYGRTSQWAPPQPQPPRFTTGRCADCDDWFTAETNGSTIAYCSRACARRVERRRRRARESAAPGHYRYADVMRQYHRQGNRCAYCNEHRGLPEPDHFLALSRGGRNDMSNIVAACKSCNAAKSDMTLDEWNADRQRRGLHTITVDLTSTAFLHLADYLPTGTAHRLRLAA